MIRQTIGDFLMLLAFRIDPKACGRIVAQVFKSIEEHGL